VFISTVAPAVSPTTKSKQTRQGNNKPGDGAPKTVSDDWLPPPPPAPPAQTSAQESGAIPKRKRETDSGKGGKERRQE